LASKEDKLLAALRSLSPPKGGAGAPQEEQPGPRRSAQEEGDGDDSSRRGRRAIELSVEEVGVFFLAATMLVVLAFLMGWYGRGIALPGAGPNEKGRAPDREIRLPRLPMGEGSVRHLGERRSGVGPSSPGRFVYTILAAKFPGSGTSEAAHYVAFLREHGFIPAFLRPTRDEMDRSHTELCVGRFASQSDPVLLDWLPRVRRLRGAFARAVIARIPDTRAPPDDTRTPAAPGRKRRPRMLVLNHIGSCRVSHVPGAGSQGAPAPPTRGDRAPRGVPSVGYVGAKARAGGSWPAGDGKSGAQPVPPGAACAAEPRAGGPHGAPGEGATFPLQWAVPGRPRGDVPARPRPAMPG
jgi:hypothetical protein